MPGAHAGSGLAERAVEQMGGMGRTLKNELECSCQMQIPQELKTIAWTIGHATTLLNLDTDGWFRWEGTVRTVAKTRTPHGRVFGERLSERVTEAHEEEKIWSDGKPHCC